MKFSKKWLLSSTMVALTLLAAPAVANAKSTSSDQNTTTTNTTTNVDPTQIQVNQTNPQQTQQNVTNNDFLNKPDNTLQQNTNTTNTYNSTKLIDYSDKNFENDFGFSHFTRYNLDHMQDGINTDAENPIGDFSGIKISDVPVAKDTRKGNVGQQMNVWDSWPLQDANGNEVTYKGYHVVFALTGNPRRDYKTKKGQYIQDSRIFVYYQKVGDENDGISSWKSAGPLFLNSREGTNGDDAVLNRQKAQWSGETVQMSDGSIHVFYTTFDGTQKDSWQSMATAKISLKADKNGITVDHDATSGHKTILEPDGYYYQKLSQAKNDNTDENAFRDAHYFEYQGNKYVIFESNTGPVDGYQGSNQLYNMSYFGGDDSFQQKEQNLVIPTKIKQNIKKKVKTRVKVKGKKTKNGKPVYKTKVKYIKKSHMIPNPWNKPATDYNGSVGIAELNDDYTVKKIMHPLMGMNTITDEMERPNIFEHNGKWYLFGITRGYKLATPNVKSSNSFMLGFVADSPFGPFKPLNNNGLVIRNTRAWSSRYYEYSFYVLNNNNDNSNKFVVTGYMTNTKQRLGHQTFAPSFTINLDGDNATVNQEEVLPQNATTTDNTNFIK